MIEFSHQNRSRPIVSPYMFKTWDKQPLFQLHEIAGEIKQTLKLAW